MTEEQKMQFMMALAQSGANIHQINLGDGTQNFYLNKDGSVTAKEEEAEVEDAEIIVSGTETSSPTDGVAPRGPRKHALFENPDTHQEDVAVKNREKQRFCDYLSMHRMKSRQLVCAKDDTLNKTVVCFLKVWLEKGTISESPSGGAVFRFLTEDCGLSTSVTERSYANEIKERLKEIKTGYDTEIYLMVKKCFEE